jgi:putative lipoic acid-binding regulatory protein
VENTPNKRKQLMSLFDSKNVSVKEKISSNSKYISISITKEVSSAESVIKTYKSVSKIEGIISL